MKVISKEEEEAHYKEVLRGGFHGGGIGLVVGMGAVLGASRRYASFRALTLPFRAFLVSSSTTAAAIITAEHYSHAFQKAKDPMNFYKGESQRTLEEVRRQEGEGQKLIQWAREHRYTIVLGSWVAAMAVAGTIVGRNPYLTGAQKLVQARMYAQGLTLGVLIATAALETNDARSGQGRWETVLVADPNDPEHKHLIEKRIHKEEYEGQDLWKDMVAAEERRLEGKKEQQAVKKEAAKARESAPPRSTN